MDSKTQKQLIQLSKFQLVEQLIQNQKTTDYIKSENHLQKPQSKFNLYRFLCIFILLIIFTSLCFKYTQFFNYGPDQNQIILNFRQSEHNENLNNFNFLIKIPKIKLKKIQPLLNSNPQSRQQIQQPSQTYKQQEPWEYVDTSYSFQQNQSSLQQYELVLLNTTTALCLDGSPGSYYVSKSGNKNKILFYFQGGGWCGSHIQSQTIKSCYQRSKMDRGSSKYNPPTRTFSQGVLSKDSANNFKDWKKVLFNYCDGTGFQGTKKQPIFYQNYPIYFRGHNITTSVLNDLQQKFGIYSKAKRVVITGGSAGGLGTFTWVNYIKQNVKNGLVRAIPDAGIFYNTEHTVYKQQILKETFKNIMKFVNIQIDPPTPQCIQQFKQSKQDCMFAQNLYRYIKVPIFVIQSLSDTWSVANVLGLNCPFNGIQTCGQQERKIMTDYKKNMTKLLEGITSKKQNGVWSIVCMVHGISAKSQYSDNSYTIPRNSIYTAERAIQDWFKNKTNSNVHIDNMNLWDKSSECHQIVWGLDI